MIGIDILEVARIKKKLEKNSNFIKSFLNEHEIEYLNKFKNSTERICGFFCLKEAVIKAFEGKLGFKDIEIDHFENGKPFVKILKTGFESEKVEVSISHSKTVAVAVAILIK